MSITYISCFLCSTDLMLGHVLCVNQQILFLSSFGSYILLFISLFKHASINNNSLRTNLLSVNLQLWNVSTICCNRSQAFTVCLQDGSQESYTSAMSLLSSSPNLHSFFLFFCFLFLQECFYVTGTWFTDQQSCVFRFMSWLLSLGTNQWSLPWAVFLFLEVLFGDIICIL